MNRPSTAALAIALGLPSALIAHAMLFGGTHTAGGDLHAAFGWLALASVGCAIVAMLLAAYVAGTSSVQGSLLARRMCEHTPRARALVPSTACWFVAIEGAEHFAHHVPVLAALLAVCGAAFVVRSALQRIARGFAAVVVVIALALRTRECAPLRLQRLDVPYRALRVLRAHRRIGFSRPPPAFA